MSADKSGRSFFVRTSDGIVSYFWCSEKSKLLGTELLRKMKDLLIKKPSLAELTGICDSRLNCFASHFRAYLAGSVLSSGILLTTHSDNSIDSPENDVSKSSSSSQKITHFQQLDTRTNLISEDCPSPGSSSIKTAARENLRSLSKIYDTLGTSLENNPSGLDCCQEDRLQEVNGMNSLALLNFLDVVEGSTELPCAGQSTKLAPSGPSPFSPHYCWCPPVASPMPYTIESPQLSISSSSEPSSLPPLSILLTSTPLLNLADIPPIDFPSLPPEPLVRLPASQQMPVFTPLVCDPIVHIPMIDVCSSGQRYLVSGGPAMSTAIQPLNPNVVAVDPLLTKTAESVVEKSARETLRMLISSNQTNPPLFEVKENALVAGSRALYGGTIDVDAMSTMEFILSSDRGGQIFDWRENSTEQKDNQQQHHPRNTDSSSGMNE